MWTSNDNKCYSYIQCTSTEKEKKKRKNIFYIKYNRLGQKVMSSSMCYTYKHQSLCASVSNILLRIVPKCSLSGRMMGIPKGDRGFKPRHHQLLLTCSDLPPP